MKPIVTHQAAARRYETVVEGHRSVCEYELEGSRMIFTHTVVPPELQGRGIAGQLVRAALDGARAAGYTVVPQCSYVATFIGKHPEYQDLLG